MKHTPLGVFMNLNSDIKNVIKTDIIIIIS